MCIRVIKHAPKKSDAFSINYVTQNGDEIPVSYSSDDNFMKIFRMGHYDLDTRDMKRIVHSIQTKDDNLPPILDYVKSTVNRYLNNDISNNMMDIVIKELEKFCSYNFIDKNVNKMKKEFRYNKFQNREIDELGLYKTEFPTGESIVSTWGVDKNGDDHLIACSGTHNQVMFCSPDLMTKDRIKPTSEYYHSIENGLVHWLSTSTAVDMFVFMNMDSLENEELKSARSIEKSIVEINENQTNKIILNNKIINEIIEICRENSAASKVAKKL